MLQLEWVGVLRVSKVGALFSRQASQLRGHDDGVTGGSGWLNALSLGHCHSTCHIVCCCSWSTPPPLPPLLQKPGQWPLCKFLLGKKLYKYTRVFLRRKAHFRGCLVKAFCMKSAFIENSDLLKSRPNMFGKNTDYINSVCTQHTVHPWAFPQGWSAPKSAELWSNWATTKRGDSTCGHINIFTDLQNRTWFRSLSNSMGLVLDAILKSRWAVDVTTLRYGSSTSTSQELK